jgi:hypothetical protein
MSVPRRIAAFAIFVGLCDASTGVALIVAPLRTLGWLGIAAPLSQAVFVQWIGAFVLAVGLSYLYPFAPGANPARRAERLRSGFEITAIVRGAVALVTGAALLAGELEPDWLGVPVFDGVVALLQVAMLARWEGGDA